MRKKLHSHSVTTTPLHWSIIVVVAALQILAAFLGVCWYFTHTNTLANNPSWSVTKSTLAFPGSDADHFKKFSPALAQNSLNLSAWRAFHEVITKSAFDWTKLEFKIKPSDHSYLYIIFDYSETAFNAIRISFTPLYRPALITAKYTGEFLSQKVLPPLPFTESEWQTLTIERSLVNSNEYSLSINGTYLTSFSAEANSPSNKTAIGFRGGQKTILVDSIKIWNRDSLVFSENFDNQKNLWRSVGTIVIILAILHGGMYALLRNFPNKMKSYLQLTFVMSSFFVLAFFIALLLEQPLRKRYPDFTSSWHTFINGPQHTADVYLTKKTEWIFQDYPIQKPKNTKRIILLGSSQVDGEGTSKYGEDVSSQLQKILNEKLSTAAQKWQVIPAGISGNTAESLLEVFKYQWLKYQPDLVIVHLSSNDATFMNDGPEGSFRPALEEFIALAKEHNFRLAFSTEPNAIEVNPTLKTHAIMHEVGLKNQIPVLKTHEYMATQTDRGILWWDFVHLTSFGYQLMSEYLYAQLEPLLKQL